MPARLYLRQLPLGPMDNFVYLVGPADGDTCAVVDPAWDVPAIFEAVQKDGRRLTHAFLTHSHHDHWNGLRPVLEKQAVKVVVQGDEVGFSRELAAMRSELTTVGAGDVVDVGGLAVKCIHTPGHTPGSQCLQVGGGVITGDTLFIGACGRCNLAGGDVEAMFESLQQLRKLDPTTTVYPGHDYGDTPTATIGAEMTTNPYLKLAERDAFSAYRLRPRR